MTMPSEEDLREFVRVGWSDARISSHCSVASHTITRLRKALGITASNPSHAGPFAPFEREIKALVERGAAKKMAGVRFEDSPAAIRAHAGYGPLPPRVDYALRGGSMIQLENC